MNSMSTIRSMKPVILLVCSSLLGRYEAEAALTLRYSFEM